MLKDHVKGNVPDKDVLKTMIREEEAKLSGSLMKIKEAKLPVMVICEGWGGAGKGSTLISLPLQIYPDYTGGRKVHLL